MYESQSFSSAGVIDAAPFPAGAADLFACADTATCSDTAASNAPHRAFNLRDFMSILRYEDTADRHGLLTPREHGWRPSRPPASYSVRSERIGSIRAARRAGNPLA